MKNPEYSRPEVSALEPINYDTVYAAILRYREQEEVKNPGQLVVQKDVSNRKFVLGRWMQSPINPEKIVFAALTELERARYSTEASMMAFVDNPDFLGMTEGGVPKMRYHGDSDPTDLGLKY